MANTVLIKQFKNKAKRPVAGLTPEHAIYDSKGVRLDAKLGQIDLSEFRKAQDEGVTAINTAKGLGVSAVQEQQTTSVNAVASKQTEAVAAVEAKKQEILAETDASDVSASTVGLDGDNVQDNLTSASSKITSLDLKIDEKADESEVTDLAQNVSEINPLLDETYSRYIVGMEVNFAFKKIELTQITFNTTGKFVVLTITFTDDSTTTFIFTSSVATTGFDKLTTEHDDGKSITILCKYYGETVNASGLSVEFNRTAIARLDGSSESEEEESASFSGVGFLNSDGSTTGATQYSYTEEFVAVDDITNISLHLFSGAYIVLYKSDKSSIAGAFTVSESGEVLTLDTFKTKIASMPHVAYAKFSMNNGYSSTDYVKYKEKSDVEKKVDELAEDVDELSESVEEIKAVITKESYSLTAVCGVSNGVLTKSFSANDTFTLKWDYYDSSVVYPSLQFCDASGLSLESISLVVGEKISIVVPVDCEKLKFSCAGTTNDKATIELVVKEGVESEISDLQKGSFAKWLDKTISVLGDSIVYGVGSSTTAGGWVTRIAEMIGAKSVVNCGIGGSTIGGSTGASGSAGYFPMWGRISADTSEWVNGSTTPTSTYADRVISANSDLIVVAGGVNDFGQSVPMGTFLSTDTSTFKGALNVMLTNLFTRFSSKEIAFILPMKCNCQTSGSESYNTFLANSVGFKESDYIDAIKETLDYYSIPYLDMYAQGGFTPYTTYGRSNFFVDGLHPNDTGYDLMAKKIASWLNSL